LILEPPVKRVELGADGGRVRTDTDIEEELVPALLPDDEAGLSWRLAVQENFPGADGTGLDEIAESDRDPLNHGGAIDNERFAGRQNEFPGTLGRRSLGLSGCG